VFFTGLLNSISEIGFPDWCSQLVLLKNFAKAKKPPAKVALIFGLVFRFCGTGTPAGEIFPCPRSQGLPIYWG
jgi:hypothetical protein